MNKRSALCLAAVSVALILISVAGTAFAQTPTYDPSARPMYVTLPAHANPYLEEQPASAGLPQWTFTWTSSHNNVKYNSVILGGNPSTSNATTTIEVGIIPIKMVYGSSNGNMTFDPNTTGQFGSLSTTQMINSSLIFKALVDYNQGGTDLGTTQYEDAYMRGNWWGYGVSKNTNYHLILKTLVGPEQTFTVPSDEGNVIANPWSGIPTGTADINWFDDQLQTVISKYSCTKIKEPCISPAVLPLFVTDNVYLTEDGGLCCIGGYHSANFGSPQQTYSYSTSIQQTSAPPDGIFSQDIAALSHEVGEWIMDPFTDNASPCINDNTILEVGDPLELDDTFGDYPYKVGSFTYHPQDLVFITWFGAPPTTSLDKWNGQTENVTTFQNENLGVCVVN
jgi:hypothetical protein